MKIGDLVFASYDLERGITCIGLVLEVKKSSVRKYSNTETHSYIKVMWSSKHSLTGWWREDRLRLVSEGRRSCAKKDGTS
jgi:hypothetical protein